ncbi:nitronate monooxygenase [Deltaproteobacteria bacterium TL4]
MSKFKNTFTEQVGIEVPVICGAMYPCSNPELIAAVSKAGGIGIIQPIAMVFVHRHDFREGIRLIRSLTDKPIGMNLIVEKSVKAYIDRMQNWMDIALEEGVRFFISALGNPKWVVDKAHASGGIVYHNVTEKKWAKKALDQGVDGLVCVNNRAGGHAGNRSPQQLFEELSDFNVPLICAGGVGADQDFANALKMGYMGVQMGTRFIASEECHTHQDYKQAILDAEEKDIVLTDKISGVPCSIIRTPSVDKMGLKAGFIARQLLQGRKTKHWMRTLYSVQSLWKFKRSSQEGMSYKDFFQAGKSVSGIHSIQSAEAIVHNLAQTVL